jgi:NADPH2:quinone reductase
MTNAAASAAARKMMRAVLPAAAGGLDALTVGSVPRPVLKTGEVLVKVAATAVNRGDIAQRKGFYPPPNGVTDIMGLEFSGTVVDVEHSLEDSPGYVPENGSKVMGLLSGGGYAEYVTVPAAHCIPVPEGLSLIDAAAIPETYLTAFQCIHHHGGLLPDPSAAEQYAHGLRTRPPADLLGRKYRMLVHAGASGVGVAACQIGGLFDIVTVATSSESKVSECAKYATYAVSRKPNEKGVAFQDKVESVVGKNGIDLVLDPVFGGTYTAENGNVLAMDGTIVVLSFLGGSKLPELSGSSFFQKRATIRYSSLRSQSHFYKTGLVASFRRRVMPAIASGKIRPVVAKKVLLDDIREAHRVVEANELVGKCVVVVDKSLA